MDASGPITIDAPLSPDVLSFVSLHGHEALGEPYEFVVDLTSQDANIDLGRLLGQPMAVHLELAVGHRHFHGYVASVDFVEKERPGAAYRVV